MSVPSNLRADRREILLLGAGAALLSLAPNVGAAAAPLRQDTLRLGRSQPFDLGWCFHLGAGDGFEAPTLDDAGWRSVDLPHDWSIEDLSPGPGRIGPFDKAADGGTASGFTLGGEGWYRKRFRLGELPADGRVEILFDGVAMVSDVWLNGHHLGDHVHSYTPFAYDLTPHLVRGGDNVLALRVRNIGRTSRWYSGSGIDRPVSIDVFAEPARVARWGVAAWTRRADSQSAEIDVTTTIEAAEPSLTLRTRLKDHTGKVVAEAASPAAAEVRQTLRLDRPRLWSPDAPELYTLESSVVRGQAVVDTLAQPFGVRIVTFDAQQGMRINGQEIKLRGGCVHNDNGLLGAAAFPEADARRVRLLKARGFNAVRSSHNPASRAFREACDRQGMLLIEEAFDSWHVSKRPQDYSLYFKDRWKGDLGAMVLSARNSPSVIMWSIGNEIPDRTTPEGLEWSWRLANEVHRLDPTRPVTAAINSFTGRPVIPAAGTARPGHEGQADYAATVFLDVVGYNYKLPEIEGDHAKFPDRVYFATETFPKDAFDYQALGQRAPYMLGEFVWTAMDYIGEAGIGLTARAPAKTGRFVPVSFPVINAYCGDIDLIGQQKPQSRARDVVWGLSPLEIAVQPPLPPGIEERVPDWGWPDELPSWTWPGSEGRPLSVRLYTSGDRVELRLNGAAVGAKALTSADRMRAEILTPYASGLLEAVAYRGGVEIGRRTLATVGAPAKLRLTPEAPTSGSSRQALSYIGVEVLDAAGRLVPDAALKVRLSLAGPAELVGFGAGGPRATGSFQSSEADTFQGRALAILRARGRRGPVRLQASASALQPAVARVRLV